MKANEVSVDTGISYWWNMEQYFILTNTPRRHYVV